MKAMLHKLPVRIIVYVLAVISMLLTAGSFAGLIVNNLVDEEQLRADLYWRAGNTYSRDILSQITYDNGVPSYTPMDYPFMDYTIVYSNENFSVENAADKAKVLFSTKEIKLTNLPLSSTESINGTRLAHGIVFGGDNIYHMYDLDHLNIHGYSYSSNAQFDNTVNVMIYFEIDTSINPAGYRLLEDGYMYADVIDSLVSLSIPTFIIALVVLIMSLVALVSGTGDNFTFFAKIPFIIHLCGFGLIEVGLGALGIWILDETFSFNLLSIPSAIVLGLLIALVMITVFLWTIVNYTRRIKAHKFYQTTLLYLVVKGIKKVVRFLTNNVPVTIKAIVGIIVLSLIQLLVLSAIFAEPVFGLFLAVIYKLAVIALVIKVLLDWKKIKDGSKRYATGDLSADINTAKMIPELRNPTVVIVDDRIDLETQITATFNASDIPNLESASSKEELINFFKGDMRKILITTIFKFGEVDCEINARDNIILMVDEAHRTQEGDLGAKMRLALPNAFFFGLTGTPINRVDHNTFATFGATEDKTGYMSKYSFSDSIRDGATLPLRFEPVPVDLHVDQETLDKEFDALTEGLTKEQKAELSSRVNMKAIFYNPSRIQKVCEHIVKHYREKIEPNGYKGQIVCYDRESCIKYKEILDTLMDPEETTVVIDTNNDKEDRYKAYRRSKDEEAKVLDQFRDPKHPLKLVIVTAKLLTGFDAPILQAMYLDKPMKDHTLLQAICRTNRTYEGKDYGLIVDYTGIFDNVARALDFDESTMKKIITNIQEVKKQFPALLKKCLSYFMGVDRTVEGWEGLMAAQECLPTSKEKDAFASDYRVLNRAWNALSPDDFLKNYMFDYKWLSKVYESVKPTDGTGKLIWNTLGPKTIELVHKNVTVGQVHDDEDILNMDAQMIDDFIDKGGDPKKRAKHIEINLVAKILSHNNDKRFVRLGEKLEELRMKHEQGLITSIEFLKLLLELAKEAAEAEKEVVPEDEIDKGKAALTELFNSIKGRATPIIVERIVKDIDDIVRIVRFDGWQNTTAGKQEVKKALRSVIWIKYKIKDIDVFDKACKYVEMYY